jgi:hypothetical protein
MQMCCSKARAVQKVCHDTTASVGCCILGQRTESCVGHPTIGQLACQTDRKKRKVCLYGPGTAAKRFVQPYTPPPYIPRSNIYQAQAC